MIKSHLRHLYTPSRSLNPLILASVRASVFEMQREKISIDGQISDLPVPVGERFHERSQLCGDALWTRGLVVESDIWCVEGVHSGDVVAIGGFEVGLVEFSMFVVLGEAA